MHVSEIEVRVSSGGPEIDLDALRRLLHFTLEHLAVEGDVSVWICTDGEIADLHQNFLDISGPTDVMSFPGDPPLLGDIAVSFEMAAEQAEDVGHSAEREIAYLALHGLLHLIGYDDIDPADRLTMHAFQDFLIERFDGESTVV